MFTDLVKRVALVTLLTFSSILINNANASQTDDLVAGVKNSDVNSVKLALEKGGDPNILICDPSDKFLPSDNEQCQFADTLYPLIWAAGIRVNDSYKRDDDILSILKLLSSYGFSSSIFSINNQTKEKVLPAYGITERLVDKSADRALVMVSAGYIPSTKVLDEMKSNLADLQKNIRLLQQNGIDDAARFTSQEVNRRQFLDVMSDRSVVNAPTSIEAARAVGKILCKADFDKLNTINEYQNHIRVYEKKNLCNSVPKAKEKLALLIKTEKQRKIQEEKASADNVQSEAARQAKEKKQIATFRKTITDGDETNCGPVIEVKGKLVKVAIAVANYGNEHWIRRDQIFPSGYGCRFINGQYQAPNM